MSRLQVEELEPRQLLHGLGLSPPRPPSQPFADGSSAALVAERSPPADFDGRHPGWSGQGGFAGGGGEVGPSDRIALRRPDARVAEAPGPRPSDAHGPATVRGSTAVPSPAPVTTSQS